jgi:hypothetical protein
MAPVQASYISAFFVLALWLHAAPVEVVIVAGQSNALNWHAAAKELPADDRDRTISFYYETGGPPNRGTAPNSTSDKKWSVLAAQRQTPFVKFERDFFGPEISLARRLSAQLPRLAVIKLAYFGTTLAVDWHPSAAGENKLYQRMQEHVGLALRQLRERGDEPHLAGLFWMQGETDGASAAHAAAYAENLARLIERVRADFGDATLPFVLGRVGPRPPNGYHHQDAVRAAQVHVPKITPRVAWVDTDDLRRDTDRVHLLSAGVMTLGERMADAWLALTSSPPPKL